MQKFLNLPSVIIIMGKKVLLNCNKAVRSNKKTADNVDIHFSGNYMFQMIPHMVEGGGELRAMKAGHCQLKVYTYKNNVQGPEIKDIYVELSALPSAMVQSTHCKRVYITIFNVAHLKSCAWTSEIRGRVQETVMRAILKMYHGSIRVTTDGLLEYQGVTGVPACHNMYLRFACMRSSKSLQELVFREGSFYTGIEFVEPVGHGCNTNISSSSTVSSSNGTISSVLK